ncbi:putative YAP-binding/ALF4/Glomulin [Helianthus debilis subsp. tardiflorus]
MTRPDPTRLPGLIISYTNTYFSVFPAFEALQRRPFEQVKAALPVVIKVLQAVLSNPEDADDTNSVDLLNKSILIAHSLNTICINLVSDTLSRYIFVLFRVPLTPFNLPFYLIQQDGKDKKLIALFGLYVLQITVLISNSVGAQASICFPMMLQLSNLLNYCGFTYLGLITGHELDTAVDLLSQGDEDDYMSCFSHVRCGAALTVLWGDLFTEVGDATKQDLKAVKDELSKYQSKRWEAVGMLKHIFTSTKLPWELKKHAIDLLFCIVEGANLQKDRDASLDYSVYTPSLYASLQAIQLVIVYASDPLLRKKAFDTFKMIAILLGCVKEEMHREYPQKVSKENESAKAESNSSSPFWTDKVLDFVEFVLRPPHGGPPILPEFTDAVTLMLYLAYMFCKFHSCDDHRFALAHLLQVLSALNLYRFILITESSGNTNYSQVSSKNKLQKVYREWLEPLRALVCGVRAENQKDNNELAFDALCGLNPVEFVLYRCIELVEENLKRAS